MTNAHPEQGSMTRKPGTSSCQIQVYHLLFVSSRMPKLWMKLQSKTKKWRVIQFRIFCVLGVLIFLSSTMPAHHPRGASPHTSDRHRQGSMDPVSLPPANLIPKPSLNSLKKISFPVQSHLLLQFLMQTVTLTVHLPKKKDICTHWIHNQSTSIKEKDEKVLSISPGGGTTTASERHRRTPRRSPRRRSSRPRRPRTLPSSPRNALNVKQSMKLATKKKKTIQSHINPILITGILASYSLYL